MNTAHTGSVEELRAQSAAMMREAGIVLSPAEETAIDVVDFGLGRPKVEGAQILTHVDTRARVIWKAARFTC